MPTKSVAAAVVSRIAYICSDAVIDLQPKNVEGSLFTKTYQDLSRKSTRQIPVVSVQPSADPGSYILHHRHAGLVSFTSISSSRTLIQLLPHLSELSSTPLVLHVAVDGDLSDVLTLRSAVPFFLHSASLHQAHDNTLLASKIAYEEKKVVVHAFQTEAPEETLVELSEEKIRSFITDHKRFSSISRGRSVSSNGSTNGHSNGHTNGHSNGHANGHTNGLSNGISNGHGVNGTNGTNGVLDDTTSESSFSTSSGSQSPSSPQTDDASLLELYGAYESASLSTVSLVRRPVLPITKTGPADPRIVIFVLGKRPTLQLDGVLWVEISLVSPLLPSKILKHIPVSATHVVVLE